MADKDRQMERIEIPFRGTGKATDFHDIQNHQESTSLNSSVGEFSKEHPLTSVVSVFGFGLIVGAGVAAAVIASKEKKMSSLYSLDDLRSVLGDSMAKVVPETMREAFHRS